MHASLDDMSSRARKVLEDAYSLSASDRAIVAVELARSVDERDEVRVAWVEESVRRLEALERGESETLTMEEVRAEIARAIAGR
jgi:hypothetical protein